MVSKLSGVGHSVTPLVQAPVVWERVDGAIRHLGQQTRICLSNSISVRLDMFYVENWSMISDLLIALKTVKAMVGHSGAY